MQGACISTGTLQFDKTDPRCLPLYQAGNGVSDNWKVMSLAQGHLKVLLAIWNKNTEWWMICLCGKDYISNDLGKKEIWAETQPKATRIPGANEKSSWQIQDGKPRFATFGMGDFGHVTAIHQLANKWG